MCDFPKDHWLYHPWLALALELAFRIFFGDAIGLVLLLLFFGTCIQTRAYRSGIVDTGMGAGIGIAQVKQRERENQTQIEGKEDHPRGTGEQHGLVRNKGGEYMGCLLTVVCLSVCLSVSLA